MRICYLSSKSTHIRNWSSYFGKTNQVWLVTDQKDKIANVQLYTYLNKGGLLTSFIKLYQINKSIKKICPDILHIHQISTLSLYGVLTGFKPIILSAWGDDIASYPDKSKLRKLIAIYSMKKANLIHVQDLLSKKKVMELGAHENKILVLPWGVNLNKFNPELKNIEFREKIQKLPGPVVILIRNDEERFLNTLSSAIDNVCKRISDINFLIINRSYKYKKILSKNVQIIEELPEQEIPMYLANADLFIDPYHPEKENEYGHAFGMALLEAMACGTPTIVANRPTISWLKGKDKWYFGEIYEGDNSEDLAEKIIGLLENNKKREEIIKANKMSVEKRFDWNKNMSLITKKYKEYIL